eukprot:g22351.t1
MGTGAIAPKELHTTAGHCACAGDKRPGRRPTATTHVCVREEVGWRYVPWPSSVTWVQWTQFGVQMRSWQPERVLLIWWDPLRDNVCLAGPFR